MKRIIAFLASDAASVALLAVLVLVVALGTVLSQNAPFETYVSAYGLPAAYIIVASGLNDVYHSGFLLFPSALFAANLFNRASRVSLSFTALMVVAGAGLVTAGALYGAAAGWEGFLPISVGESKNIVLTNRGAYRLPFTVSLDDFSIEQGAASIENFESTLCVRTENRELGRGVTGVNRPFRLNGVSFYQQAYDPSRPRWTGLKVVYDPGVAYVFLGLGFLNAGIIAVVAGYAKREREKDRA